jgi:uncharacterized damage-inducible protein DinB
MLEGQLLGTRERLLASFEGLSEEEMVQPGVRSEWSVRDILAHIAAWDRAATEAYGAMVRGERPPLLDLDEEGIAAFDEERHQATIDASLEEVLSELSSSREALLEFLKWVDNKALFAPAPGDEHADLSIAACLQVNISHDEEYAGMIEEWREERDQESGVGDQ